MAQNRDHLPILAQNVFARAAGAFPFGVRCAP
jgi:hypothetical protein